mgnify:CR=1 FL=1
MVTTSETLPKSGYTADTPKRYLLNAGALVRNLTWDSSVLKWSYDEFGATSGGSKLTLKNNLRQVEVDGVFTTPVGGDMIESSEGTFEINVIEHTRDNIKMSLFANSKDSSGNKKNVFQINGINLGAIDWNQLLELIDNGVIGKLIEVHSADGDLVEIYVE